MKRDLILLLARLSVITAFLTSCASYQGAPSAYQGTPAADAAAPSSAMRAAAPIPRHPGLATGWGNETSSPISIRDFKRASSKPAGTDTIYYNDPQGIAAMASRTTRVKGMQTAAGSLVEWGIKGRFGFLPTYKEDWGRGRRFVAGAIHSNYSIVVHNTSKSTLEVVASVDGLDVQDGKPASFSKRGYLIDPGKTLTIKGFRTSYDHVAAFKFSSVSGSYANLRHGDTRNVGVIGIAVFTQKGVNPWAWMPAEISLRNQARPFAEAP